MMPASSATIDGSADTTAKGRRKARRPQAITVGCFGHHLDSTEKSAGAVTAAREQWSANGHRDVMPRPVLDHGMRLVTWNTAHRDRKTQLAYLALLHPDVAVLPEFGWHPVAGPVGDQASYSFVSLGAEGELGVSVAAWGPWSVRTAEVGPLDGGVMGAVDVEGPLAFRLIAAWPYLSKRLPVNPIVEAVDKWSAWLKGYPVVVAGDFNTGGAWVKKEPWKDHRLVVAALEGIGLRSAYHAHRDTAPGKDEVPTHWHNRYGPFHIDHVFAPVSWPIRDVSVGPADPWQSRSDHAPVLVDYAIGC